MLRRSVVLLALACAAGTALAQTPSAPPSRPAWHGQGGHSWVQRRRMMQRYQMKRLTVLLDLTPAQQRNVKAVMAAERARMRPATEKLREAIKEMRAARMAARRAGMRKLGSVLSATQMRKLKLLMPAHPRFMMRGRGMGMMGHGMGMMGAHPMAPVAPPPPPASPPR